MATGPVLPKLPVPAEVMLYNGDDVHGEFFVDTMSSRHAGPETLLELLNDNERSFVPFKSEKGMLLLHRTAVRMVTFDSPELLEIFTRPDNECIYSLTVIAHAGPQTLELQGFCYTGELRPETRRPVDLLNSPEMFLLLYANNHLVLCNKNAISHASVE